MRHGTASAAIALATGVFGLGRWLDAAEPRIAASPPAAVSRAVQDPTADPAASSTTADASSTANKNPSIALASLGGAEVYSHICQGCHMSEAQGAVGAGHYPKLAGDPALISWEYAALTVLNGKNGMPAFGGPDEAEPEQRSVRLNDAQIASVVNYVRSHFGNRFKQTVTAANVAALPHRGLQSGL